MRSSAVLGYGALLNSLFLLCRRELVQCQSDESTCDTFLTEKLGPTTSDSTVDFTYAGRETFQETFACEDGAFVAGVNINYGWWIDALQIICSNGDASDWYGHSDEIHVVNQSYVDSLGGLTTMSSLFINNFPCCITFFAYTRDEEGSSSGSEQGPYVWVEVDPLVNIFIRAQL